MWVLIKLEAVAKVVTKACSLRDIDQIRPPDREAVTGVWTFVGARHAP